MKTLPENVRPYKKTPKFTNDTVPSGLLKSHTTKKGTWGKIVVLKGVLRYVIETVPAKEIVLSQDKFGVVEPEVPHHVTPQGEVEFYVEFYK